MFFRLLLNITFAATLVSFQTLPVLAFGEGFAPTSISDEEIATLMDQIKGQLRDPDSAKFSGIIAASKDDGKTACGWVNAKNALGGYTGKQPFWAMKIGETWAPLAIGGDQTEIQVTLSMCKDMGIPL